MATPTSALTGRRQTPVVGRDGGRKPADVGLCYGRKSSHVPTTPETLQLYKSNGISKMMLSQTDENIIPLLQLICMDSNASSELRVVLCIDHNDLSTLANSEEASRWVSEYITPFVNDYVISHVVVGDVIGSDDFSLPVFERATHNIKALLPETIKLSILVNVHFLLRDDRYYADTLPSSCRLSDEAIAVLNYLSTLYGPTFPLFVQIMPFFIPGTHPIPLDNYLLEPNVEPYMTDGIYQYHGIYQYQQVYDAMLDSICCALQKWDFLSVEKYVVSGWPTAGRPAAGERIDPSVKNAKTYNNNLAVHGETPRGNRASAVFIYSLVDEDELGTTVEEFKHFGTFIPWNIMTFPNGGQPY